MPVPAPLSYTAQSNTAIINGLETHWLEAGSGDTVVLLHSGEFGADAVISWEYVFNAFASRFRVIAPDWIGFGRSAKVHDFIDYSEFKVAHMSRFLESMNIKDVPMIGNSMAANFLIRDAAKPSPRLRPSLMVAMCGGGPVPENDARAALTSYDCTFEGMRRIVAALFSDSVWPTDDAYVARRYESSLVPGAWECSAAARLRAPIDRETASDRIRLNKLDYSSFTTPVLLMAGAEDKLKPRGYVHELAEQIPNAEAAEVESAGHCPHIENPAQTLDLIFDFIERRS